MTETFLFKSEICPTLVEKLESQLATGICEEELRPKNFFHRLRQKESLQGALSPLSNIFLKQRKVSPHNIFVVLK